MPENNQPAEGTENEMNFTEFQVQLRCVLICNMDEWDKETVIDTFNDWYGAFKEQKNWETVKGWAEHFFEDVTAETHDYYLVSSMFPAPVSLPPAPNKEEKTPENEK